MKISLIAQVFFYCFLMQPSFVYGVDDAGVIINQEKDFSINLPKNWQQKTDIKGPSLYLTPKEANKDEIESSIQIIVLNDGLPIDELTAEEYAEKLTEKYSRSSAIKNYSVTQKQIIDLDTGEKGILYYASFDISDFAMMHAHILTSSQDKHYLISYTDLASHFKEPLSDQFLSPAWNAMISFRILSGQSSPARFPINWWLGVIGAFCAFLIVLIVVRRRNRLTRDAEATGDPEDTDTEDIDPDITEETDNESFK